VPHYTLKVLAHLAYRNAAFASAMLALSGVLDVLVAVLNSPEEYLSVFVDLWSRPDQEEVIMKTYWQRLQKPLPTWQSSPLPTRQLYSSVGQQAG